MYGPVAGPLDVKSTVTTNVASDYSMKQVIEASSRWAQFCFLRTNVPTIVKSWKEGEQRVDTSSVGIICATLYYIGVVFLALLGNEGNPATALHSSI